MLRWGAYLVHLALAAPAQALGLRVCMRVTHVSHGGEADHVDLGEGRVMWRDWWSQEGSLTELAVLDCAPGTTLRAHTAEENMNALPPFDRTQDAMAVDARHATGVRVFAMLERMAGDLKVFGRDVGVSSHAQESRACAALYPTMRRTKEAFRLEGL
jgi:hypothetical protein